MRIIKDLREMNAFAAQVKQKSATIGFVPTMGALHEGHLSLVAAARRQSGALVVSIFVNPIQFAPGEDYRRYPRDLGRDRKLLDNFAVDALFLPRAEQMVPAGFRTHVEVAGLSDLLCGKSRPGHFRGVATVVAKLFNIVSPDMAFFGEKDYQQLLIIKRMVKDLNLPVEIVSLPTVREFDGLAMSSRNAYLNAAQRKSATVLNRALTQAREAVARGEKKLDRLLPRLRRLISAEPGMRLDYFAAVDPETLAEVKTVRGNVLFAAAAYAGKTRLIDNLMVEAG